MTWELLFVLPNLTLRDPIDAQFLAIVGPQDSRLLSLKKRYPTVRRLLDGFRSATNQRLEVSALLIADGAPNGVKNLDAIRSYRNLVAISSVIGGMQDLFTGSNGWDLLYSTYFDFYPMTVDRERKGLVTRSPASLGWDDANTFRGQPTAGIFNSSLLQPRPDRELLPVLLDQWTRAVTLKNPPRQLRVLFRSLEIAYQAASMPVVESLNEFGSRVAQWVSAFEILANGRYRRANLGLVLDILDEVRWMDPTLRRRGYIVEYPKKNKRRVPLAGRLYKELYRSRNSFAHGEPVDQRDLHFFRDRKNKHLFRGAVLLYKAAVMAFVDGIRDRRKRVAAASENFVTHFFKSEYEKCVAMLRPRKGPT